MGGATFFSPIAKRTKGSSTFAMTSRANKLREAGRDVISLNVGEPDFDTPDHIKEAAILALKTKKIATRYAPIKGIVSLRESISRKLDRDNHLHFPIEQIIVSTGAKQALCNCISVIVSDGDEVIIPAPHWVSYTDMVSIAGARPVIVVAEQNQGFKLTPEQLSKSITPRTKMLILNSPSNPSGAMYSAQELTDLMEIIRQHPNVVVLSDEIYEHVTLGDQKHVCPLQLAPDLKDRFIVVNGVSKAYAMTGWRIGFAAGPRSIIDVVANLQSQQSGSTNSIGQLAAEAALEGPQDCVRRMRDAFSDRQRFVLEKISSVRGLNCIPAQGGFYLFLNAKEAIHSLYEKEVLASETDISLCDYLLEKAGVALMPGSYSGMSGYIRLSFAASHSLLEKAIGRMAEAVNI
ncbi:MULTISPECIES: pyridoxal phosphate-dependent aminotransferase [Candidatus Ichthyocystis]|uniref:pyridoxal phosphate-dependent aminotransferase n=1 Tax=Candidatus Ichthyocystis TaxID=2929841 RepID=UPI000A5F44F0|nr:MULTISPECIES: pyridoxal phosphate-dependent aminotransferase [Ichthyocystis]